MTRPSLGKYLRARGFGLELFNVDWICSSNLKSIPATWIWIVMFWAFQLSTMQLDDHSLCPVDPVEHVSHAVEHVSEIYFSHRWYRCEMLWNVAKCCEYCSPERCAVPRRIKKAPAHILRYMELPLWEKRKRWQISTWIHGTSAPSFSFFLLGLCLNPCWPCASRFSGPFWWAALFLT